MKNRIYLLSAILLGAPTSLSAQTTDSNLITYQSFRYVMGANEACELLTQAQRTTISVLNPQLRSELRTRYTSEALENADLFEKGQEDGAGCPSRAENGSLWQQVDGVRTVSKALVIAPAYMQTDPGQCSTLFGQKMPRKEWKRFGRLMLDDVEGVDEKATVEAVSKNFAGDLDKDCALTKFGSTGSSDFMRPALAHLNVLEQANDSMQRKIGLTKENWNDLFSVGADISNTNPEEAFWRSRKTFTDSSNPGYNIVQGVRGSAETIAAVHMSLRSSSTFGASGLFYVDRTATFKARINYKIHALKIVSLDGGEFPYRQTSQDEGVGFLGKTYFEMDSSVRNRLFALKPETDFHVQYQEREGESWKLFKDSKGGASLAKIGWIGVAYQWANMPSALSK